MGCPWARSTRFSAVKHDYAWGGYHDRVTEAMVAILGEANAD